MSPPTNNWMWRQLNIVSTQRTSQRGTQNVKINQPSYNQLDVKTTKHRLHAETVTDITKWYSERKDQSFLNMLGSKTCVTTTFIFFVVFLVFFVFVFVFVILNVLHHTNVLTTIDNIMSSINANTPAYCTYTITYFFLVFI